MAGRERAGWLSLAVTTASGYAPNGMPATAPGPMHHAVLAETMEALVAAESARRLGDPPYLAEEVSLLAADDTNQPEVTGLGLTGAVVLVRWYPGRRQPRASWFSSVRLCLADVEAMTGSRRRAGWAGGTTYFVLALGAPLWDPGHRTVMWPVNGAFGAALKVGRLTVTVGEPWQPPPAQ